MSKNQASAAPTAAAHAVQAVPDALDYRGAFDGAPVGLVLSRQRLMMDCNREVLAMFGALVAVFQWGWFGIADAPHPV